VLGAYEPLVVVARAEPSRNLALVARERPAGGVTVHRECHARALERVGPQAVTAARAS
jgi:hypothetical protein